MKVILIVDKDNKINRILNESVIRKSLGKNIDDLTEDEIMDIFFECIGERVQEAAEYGLKLEFKTLKEEMDIVIAKTNGVDQVPGEYYAHEYDVYTDGVAIKTAYLSDSNVEYSTFFVSCLSRKLTVADGYWDEVFTNGCGDTFTPDRRFSI